MKGFLQVITTSPSKENALAIARELVEKRFAACVQTGGPIRSVYHWQETIEEADEWICLIKTSEDLFPACEKAIRAVHPYEVPEIIALPLVCGSSDYLGWLAGELAPPQTGSSGSGKPADPPGKRPGKTR